ncbi:APC family permease [Metabacillus sediminilitoris]|uniref:APC family permease n=1 Tax=Metabacillus sediminilitoris TaxID=2567941 RepID=A0A4S4BUR2_9BACI|nr:amino acid permease [Metabacillus sediminilitoris]THF78851.1 APC family permease [Metabacillus sediminilitoris]
MEVFSVESKELLDVLPITSSEPELKRTLKFRDLVIFGLGFMAPVAAMSLFGIITLVSQGHSVLSYIIGFVAMLFTAYSFGKMVEAYPVAGSTYTYAQRALHPRIGFIAGWGMLLDYLLIPMLTFLISANFANALVPSIPIWIWVLIFALPITIVNIIGIEVAAKVNTILVLLMVMAVVAFVISAGHYIVTGDLSLIDFSAIYSQDSFSIGAIISGAAIVIVAYLGFDAITTLAEETDIGGNKIGWGIIFTCVIQTVFFVSVTYLAVILQGSYTSIENPDTAFFDVLNIIGGVILQTFVTSTIIASGVASAMASQSASSRLLLGMGRDGVIPKKFFGYIHPTFKTPVNNILLMSILGIIGAILMNMQLVSDLVAFGGLLGFSFVNVCVINHYYIKNKQRNFFKFLFVPLMGMAVCLYILWGLSTAGKIVGFTWMGIGLIYLLIRSYFSKEFKRFIRNKNEEIKTLVE